MPGQYTYSLCCEYQPTIYSHLLFYKYQTTIYSHSYKLFTISHCANYPYHSFHNHLTHYTYFRKCHLMMIYQTSPTARYERKRNTLMERKHSSHFKGGVRNYWQSQQGTVVIVNESNITDCGRNTLRIKKHILIWLKTMLQLPVPRDRQHLEHE